MAAEIPLVPSVLAAMILETLLYGVYLIVFSFSMRTIFFSHFSSGSFLRTLLVLPNMIAVAMFISVTGHWVVDLVRLYDAFVYNVLGGPTGFYSNPAVGTNVAKTYLYVSQAIMGDVVLVYRLYYVYNRSWKICLLPTLTTLTAFVAGFGGSAEFGAQGAGANIYLPVYARWFVTGYITSMTTNIYASVFLGVRMWGNMTAMRGKRHGGGLAVWRIVEIVIESAVIYTACTIFNVVCYLARTNLFYPIWDLTSPVMGLVFCMIIVRVKMHSPSNNNTAASARSGETSHQMNPISINIREERVISGKQDSRNGGVEVIDNGSWTDMEHKRGELHAV